MKESTYKTCDDLPLFLNAAMIAQVLGIAPSSAYELMHEVVERFYEQQLTTLDSTAERHRVQAIER